MEAKTTVSDIRNVQKLANDALQYIRRVAPLCSSSLQNTPIITTTITSDINKKILIDTFYEELNAIVASILKFLKTVGPVKETIMRARESRGVLREKGRWNTYFDEASTKCAEFLYLLATAAKESGVPTLIPEEIVISDFDHELTWIRNCLKFTAEWNPTGINELMLAVDREATLVINWLEDRSGSSDQKVDSKKLRRWPELTLRVDAESGLIEITEAGCKSRQVDYRSMGLKPADFRVLCDCARADGDLSAGKSARAKNIAAAEISRLSKGLKAYFSNYDDKPIPALKARFKIERMSKELDKLIKESNLDLDEFIDQDRAATHYRRSQSPRTKRTK